MKAAALFACALLGAVAAGPAAAHDAAGFSEAYAAALRHDADHRVARHELESQEQARRITRAALLPNVAATYSESRVRGDRESPNALGQSFTQALDYRNPAIALQLRAPLLNLEASHRDRSAALQVEAARSVFVARGQELLDRLGVAYAQRLFAQEAVALAQAQHDAYRAQAEMAERRFGAGEGTRTEVADAAAAVALARVQLIEAGDQRDIAQRTLTRITGQAAAPTRGLSDGAPTAPLPQAELQAWIDLAAAHNPGLQARRRQLAAAKAEVERAKAGHYPRIDFVASAVDNRNDTASTLNQRVRQYSAGVQLSIPLYAGGGVEAGVMQALAQQSRAEAQLDSDREQLTLEVRRQFQANESGRLKVEALRDALEAGGIALEGTKRALEAGFRTTADVLEAVRRLFLARRDLVQARYELLIARLRLQGLAGLPVADITADIDRQLAAPLAGAVVAEGPR